MKNYIYKLVKLVYFTVFWADVSLLQFGGLAYLAFHLDDPSHCQ
jgi:hypothetical protein